MPAELIVESTGEVIQPMTTDEAAQITEDIAVDLGDMASAYERAMPKIREALTRLAWDALGYPSAGAYVSAEFGGTLGRLDVEARRGVVRELAAAGMSTRAIAPVVGAGQSTVSDDLRATDRDRSVEDDHEPDPVIGLNGKTYQRRAPRPQPQPVQPEPISPEEADRCQRERDRKEAVSRAARMLRAFLSGWDAAYGMRTAVDRDEVLAELDDTDRGRFTRIERETQWPSTRI